MKQRPTLYCIYFTKKSSGFNGLYATFVTDKSKVGELYISKGKLNISIIRIRKIYINNPIKFIMSDEYKFLDKETYSLLNKLYPNLTDKSIFEVLSKMVSSKLLMVVTFQSIYTEGKCKFKTDLFEDTAIINNWSVNNA